MTAGVAEFLFPVDDMGQRIHICPDGKHRSRNAAVILSNQTGGAGKVTGHFEAGSLQFTRQII